MNCFAWCVSLLFLPSLLAADEVSWPQWRGPDRDGSASFFQAGAWPDKLEQVWRVPVGKGYGSPVYADGRLFLITSAGDKREQVLCLDLKDGKILWQHEDAVAFRSNQYAVKFGDGPFATPLIDGSRVYTLGVTGILNCFDTKTGKVLWNYRFKGDLTDKRHFFCGNSVSPIMSSGRLIAHIGNEKMGELVALDPKTGKAHWRHEEHIPGYASPILTTLSGKKQLISLTQTTVSGFDPDNGKTLWSFPYESEWRENIVTPLPFEQTLIISGVERQTIALKVGEQGGKWEIGARWANDSEVMYMSSPVLVGNRMFGLSHKRKGQLFCMDAATGKTIWANEGRTGQNAALIRAGKHILCYTTDGALIVLDAEADTYKPLKTYQLSESAIWAHPAMLRDGMVVKDATHLTLWRKKS